MDFPCGSAGKKSAYNVGNRGSIPRLGRCPGEGNSYPLQYSGLENSVHGVSKSRTKLSNFHFHGSRPEMLSSQEKSFVTIMVVCVHAKSLQLWPTLCNPVDWGLPGSSIHGDSPGKNIGLLHPPPGDLPNLGIEPTSLTSPALAGVFFTISATIYVTLTRLNVVIMSHCIQIFNHYVVYLKLIS